MSPSPSRRPGRPPAGKPDETRKRLIQAARELFSERGYGGATFAAIAARAGVTRPAINHYFSSKRALYREVVDQTYELVMAGGVQCALRETTLMGGLTALIDNAMRVNAENPSASSLMVTALLESRRHPDLNRVEHVSGRVGRDFLTWVIDDAVERGEVVPNIDTSALVETLLLVFCGVGLYAGYLRSDQKAEAVTAILCQLLEGVFRRPDS
ncbi:TetR/AcrR family transcriptional regulator [Mycobacterium intracellulare]|uniref:TetR/AcrR family transcriptional regulator n=1 Tax=Mycobacterium intracellulare TaxID=1767 RepID=UPI0034D70334